MSLVTKWEHKCKIQTASFMIISASERLACTVMLLHLFPPYSFFCYLVSNRSCNFLFHAKKISHLSIFLINPISAVSRQCVGVYFFHFTCRGKKIWRKKKLLCEVNICFTIFSLSNGMSVEPHRKFKKTFSFTWFRSSWRCCQSLQLSDNTQSKCALKPLKLCIFILFLCVI